MAISPFVEQLMCFVKPLIVTISAVDGSEEDIEIALREVLSNAVVHGNHEDPQKKVYVTFRFRIDGENFNYGARRGYGESSPMSWQTRPIATNGCCLTDGEST